MFNTVRRMTDTNLTLLPLSKITFRAGYAQNIFQGPTLSPSYTIAKYNALLQEYQRNSTDEFTGGVDWKPVRGTKLSFETEITHFKTGSYFTLDPNGFMVQEADGTPAYLGNWDSQTAYGIAACNKTMHDQQHYHSLPQRRRDADHRSGLRCRYQLYPARSRRAFSPLRGSSGCKAPASRM